MTLKIRYILLFILIPFILDAQYSYQWTRHFGSDTLVEASSFSITPDGNIIIAGRIRNNGSHTFLQKISPNGKVLWTRSIHHHKSAIPSKIIILSDSSIIITGYMRDWEEPYENLWLAKLDSTGTMLWERVYEQFGYSLASDIKKTSDNGFIIAANQFIPKDNAFDWLVLKVDSLGLIQWHRTSGSQFNDNLNAVAVLPNNLYAVAGFVSQNNGTQKIMALSIYDSTGNELAFNQFNDLGFSEAMDVIATNDTNIVITGFKINRFYKHDIVVIKLNYLGDTIWEKTFHMPLRQIPFSLLQAFDHTFVIAYSTLTAEEPYSDIGLLQLDPNGNVIFSRLLRHPSDDFIAQIIEQKDNSLALLSTNFIIGRGWVISITKWKSLLTSDIIFLFPTKNIIATKQDSITIRGCIKSYMKPHKIEILNNNKTEKIITNFYLTQNHKCSFAFNVTLKLHFGINNLKFITTDYKGYKFIRKRVIIYIPLPNKTW